MSSWLGLPEFNQRLAEYPPLLIAAPSLALLLLFILRASNTTRALLLSALTYTALIPPLQYTTENPAADFGIASSAFQRCLIALDRFGSSSAEQLETTFTRSKQARAPAPGFKVARLVWSVENTLLMRGAGMKWEVRGVPSAGRHLGRTKFIASRIGRAALVYLVMDIVSSYMQTDPYFRRQIPFHSVDFGHRLVILISAGLAGCLALELLYDLTCAVGVFVGLWTPYESPDLFGSIKHAYTLRGFWGKTWHQCFRRVFVTPATTLIEILGLDARRWPSAVVSLVVPFALSAAQHAYAIRVMGGPGYGLQTSAFFLLQPVGIALETAVQRLLRGNAISSTFKHVAGYLWVLSWMLSVGHLFFDELVQAGMWEVNPAPLSIVKGITTGQWWAP